MTTVKTTYGRRSFIKTSVAASGGLVLGFSWLASCKKHTEEEILAMPKEWFKINGYLSIGDNGVVTIQSPNPEIGQNVKTSMPMIVADELDIDWKNVVVEQAPLNTDIFTRQLAGGSQSIRQGWESLRMAGATAREMLKQAAANKWNVPIEEITTKNGELHHSSKKAGYGEFASEAAKLPVPEEVKLKEHKDFTIIGKSTKNVDGKKIVTGKPLFGIDYTEDGAKIAMVVHPPGFGMKLKSMNADSVRSMPGIVDIFSIKPYEGVESLSFSDMYTYPEIAVVVGDSVWEVMQAKKALKVEWEEEGNRTIKMDLFGNNMNVQFPKGLESSDAQKQRMSEQMSGKKEVARKDGDPEGAFKKAAKVIESTYYAPYLAHSPMEPMNFFANVMADKAIFTGPIQTPEFMEKSLSQKLGLPLEKIEINMTRMGGGFGRRLYGHFMMEVASISQKMKMPIKLQYTREDEMTYGIYRPTYLAKYRAALDENNQLTAMHVIAGGIPESPLFENRFPAGAIDNYLAEKFEIQSNVTTGAFRAPRSNFIAGAEQAFLDEVAEAMGKDPIELRLELLEKAKNNPVGEKNDYDADRYAGVLKLAKEKSEWGQNKNGHFKGVSAYFCHDSYVANVLELVIEDEMPVIKKVICAVDCGLVVNPIAAVNMVEGGTVDGIGHALYTQLTLTDGKPDQSNFNTYRLIRHNESPKNIEVHFVKNDIDPTGLGEPPFPPVIGALANALYKAKGKRFYEQPFFNQYKGA